MPFHRAQDSMARSKLSSLLLRTCQFELHGDVFEGTSTTFEAHFVHYSGLAHALGVGVLFDEVGVDEE